ncbi:MAG: BamA/TamA family outer membrane protein [Pacificimonas sp.]
MTQTEEPIVTDERFAKELPSLDDDVSPDAMPPRNTADDADIPGDIEALPSLQDGPDAETIADAPVDDPALAEPLAPLESFDVSTIDPPTEEEAEPAETIRYYVDIEGLDEIGLEGRFRDVSALAAGDNEAANAAMLSARTQDDAEVALRLLRSQGYFDASANSEIILPAEADGRYRVELIVSPGEQYDFSSVTIEGEDKAIPQRLVSDNIAVDVGDPIVADEVLAAEASVSLIFPFNGYPFAEVGERDILLDGETKTGDYTLPVDLGPRARFGGVRSEGDATFSPEHIEVLQRFERGDVYDIRLQDDLREAMIATSLFNSVSIEPVRTGVDAADIGDSETEYVDLVVTQTEGPPRSLQGEVGFSTGRGFLLSGRWVHRNLFPPEGALEANAALGTQEQGVGVLFRRSNAGQRDRSLILGADARRQRFEAYDAETLSIIGRISRDSTPIWQKRWTYAFGFELIGSREERFDEGVGDSDRDTFLIAALPAQVGFDSSDSLLDPTEGFRATVRISPEASLQGGGVDPYVRSLGDLSGYVPFGDSFVLAGRVRAGTISGIDREDLAPSRRYYAGGGGSVRGYGFQEIGPREEVVTLPSQEEIDDAIADGDDPPEADIDFQPLGGRSVVEGAVEARYRFGNFGAVAFVDAGQVYESQVPGLSDIRYGVGIGARYYTNFGPFRADFAIPINRRPGESRFGVYISIGQAF